MADGSLDRRSPLAAWVDRFAAVSVQSGQLLSLAELPFQTQLNVRAYGRSRLPGVNTSAAWPSTAPEGTFRNEGSLGDARLLGLGPDEWLVVAAPGLAEQLEAALRADLAGALESIVDVSAQRTTLILSGPRARDVLAHGCALDLAPAVFAVSDCAQTMLAQAQVILWRTGQEAYRILVRPSFATYLASWLLDAATELLDPR